MGMLFSWSAGTDGSGSERYKAYLPFVIAPGASLKFEMPACLDFGDVKVKLERLHTMYALGAGPVQDPESAKTLIHKLQAALIWFSLKKHVGVSYSKNVQTIECREPTLIADDSNLKGLSRAAGWTHVDGHFDSDKAGVLPEHKRLVRWETGRATLRIELSAANVCEVLKEGLQFNASERVIQDQKLRLAVEIFAAYRFELSKTAQFLTLITALEALLPDMAIPDAAEQALLRAKEAAAQMRDGYTSESAEWRSVDHLLQRIGGLKRQSIARTLQDYVERVLERHPKLASPEIPRNLKDAYNARSKLLHDGTADESDMSEHIAMLSEFVPKLLAALYVEVAS
jgi:hypothetical protein